ncbi:protein-lysine methyltransferase METTL21C-like, partial [Lethenteron reissneri]|uniref:protein-lysine methyltransferase METTL21C-like n=1 Tax=Lethenteron reissneri TaxID=7753 RepID=UPI002AB6A504
ARVTATDVKEVLASLSTNITNNTRRGAGRPEVRELSWGRGLSAFDPAAYDYVVASDLVYKEASLGPLALTLSHFLAGGGEGGGATALFALKLRFGFCGEFVRRLRRTFRVRTLAEWPEDETLILELRGARARGKGGEEEGEEEEEWMNWNEE